YITTSIILVGCKQKESKISAAKDKIATDTLVYDTAPRWSNAGDKILFYTYRHDSEGAELYTVNPDKTQLTRLTETYHNEWWSDFSPEDDIIYVSSDYGKSERFGGSEIFELKADGTFTRITFSADSNSFNIHPRVSLDGSQLLYCSDCLGTDVNSEIILINADGTNPVNLTNHPSADKYGNWSPDGKSILFASNRTGNFEIYVMNLETKELTQLTNNEYDDIQGDWSINDEIVFTSNRDGDFEVFTMKSDGSDQKQITFNNDKDVLPSWSPEGDRIAFSSYRLGKKDKGDIFLINRNGENEMMLTKK
ncbi:TolB family protein, partial [Fulvivirga lutimaris]|uniref:TolB family protein n=1 Tax=Fulvivirga lutimaris TaxID=1819566 RepID=UPI0012BC7D50